MKLIYKIIQKKIQLTAITIISAKAIGNGNSSNKKWSNKWLNGQDKKKKYH